MAQSATRYMQLMPTWSRQVSFTGHRAPKNMPKRHKTDAYKCVPSATIRALSWKKKARRGISCSTEIKKKEIDSKKAKTYNCWKHKLFLAFQYNMKTKEAYTDPWIMHLLTRDLWTNDFCRNNCSLFLEILASLKLVNYTKLDVKPVHSTRLRTNHSDSEPGGPRI